MKINYLKRNFTPIQVKIKCIESGFSELSFKVLYNMYMCYFCLLLLSLREDFKAILVSYYSYFVQYVSPDRHLQIFNYFSYHLF